ncbi:MAG: hypothetical protein AABY32_01355 [Nanoarchaeota archaeon]
MKRIYLSIDLDYFYSIESAEYIIDSVLEIEIPTVFVVMHQYLVKHINKFHPDVLINIDAHDDCAIHAVKHPKDYNWVNKIAKSIRKNGVYKWVTSDDSGFCVGEDGYNNQWEDNRIPWKKYYSIFKYSDDLHFSKIANKKEIVACGIALSPDFTPHPIREWAKKRFKFINKYV